jgi:hypothetical protein
MRIFFISTYRFCSFSFIQVLTGALIRPAGRRIIILLNSQSGQFHGFFLSFYPSFLLSCTFSYFSGQLAARRLQGESRPTECPMDVYSKNVSVACHHVRSSLDFQAPLRDYHPVPVQHSRGYLKKPVGRSQVPESVFLTCAALSASIMILILNYTLSGCR